MTSEEAAAALRAMISGNIVSIAVGSAARLGVPDALAGGPRTADEIAPACGAHAPSLRRLMRALAAFGVLSELPDGRFELTEIGALLREDVPGSWRPLAMLFGGGPHARGWAAAIHSFRTGETATEGVLGVGTFEALAREPEEQAIFDRAMTANTRMLIDEILGHYDFSRFATIVDVGGGHGLLLARVLAANAGARGILFDAPHVVEGASAILDAEGVSERCAVAGGDFFDAVPGGGDLYMMKAIIHDWDDPRAETILRNCRARMDGDATLLVIDRLMPERITPGDEAARRAVIMDLNMLVMVSGRERTETEFHDLFERTGFKLTGATRMPSGVALVEGAPT